MSFTVSGVITQIDDAVQVTEKMQKRLFVIEKPGKYPEVYAFDLINDRCDLIDSFSTGEEVEVSFNISCREWNGKYFTNLGAWKIQPTKVAERPQGKNEQKPESTVTAQGANEQFDDLPF